MLIDMRKQSNNILNICKEQDLDYYEVKDYMDRYNCDLECAIMNITIAKEHLNKQTTKVVKQNKKKEQPLDNKNKVIDNRETICLRNGVVLEDVEYEMKKSDTTFEQALITVKNRHETALKNLFTWSDKVSKEEESIRG